MRFQKLEIEDIFAYNGPSEIDLSECTDERNIVIVQGRNGRGKTSLLNAVKLLFLGVEDRRLRRVGVGASELSPKQFVVGQTGRWYGVLNTIARESGAPARVALNWLDGGRECRAERIYWPLRGATDYREQLNVTIDRQQLDDTAAQTFLQNLLPKETVPFFFFDGEQIQSIADAEIGREQADIERLLNLSFVVQISREVEAYGRQRRSAGLPETVQAQIAAAEGAQRTACARVEAAARARIILEEEIRELDAERKRIDAERNRLRGGLSEEDRRRMLGRILTISSQRETIANRIALAVPVEAPALANLALVGRAFGMLEEQLSGSADAPLATRLHRSLPDALVDALGRLSPQVELEPAQEVELREQVGEALVVAGVARTGQENPIFASLSPRKLRALRDRFLLWNTNGDATAMTQADLLRQARQLAHDERQLRQELDEAEITSDEARQRHAALTAELETVNTSVREKVAEQTMHVATERTASREAAEQADEIKRLYAEQEHVIREDRGYQMSRKARTALEIYRHERRKLIRAAVEGSLDRRAQLLLGPSQLVKEVRLDENFGMSYFDAHGDEVGRHSLSAGMRQLAAMAMLWALKDEAKRPLPVIIDTPLGRIDKENRALLMSEYFPKAGMPLILLPTDTELSEEDLAGLSDHVAIRYEIQNTGGNSAKVLPVRHRPAGAQARG